MRLKNNKIQINFETIVGRYYITIIDFMITIIMIPNCKYLKTASIQLSIDKKYLKIVSRYLLLPILGDSLVVYFSSVV